MLHQSLADDDVSWPQTFVETAGEATADDGGEVPVVDQALGAGCRRDFAHAALGEDDAAVRRARPPTS